MLLSFCIFVKNDEDCIEGLLESVIGIADEIVIVNTGSTDSTMERCGKFVPTFGIPFETFRTYEARFTSLGNMKTLAAHLARGEWVLMIDADERLDISDSFKIRQLCENSDLDTQMYTFPIKYWNDLNMQTPGRETEWKTKLFRNRTSYYYSPIDDRTLRGLSNGTERILPRDGLCIHNFQALFPKRCEERQELFEQSVKWDMEKKSFWDNPKSFAHNTPSISFCMIIKNEEHCIEGLLRQLRESGILNEIVIVDTGSTDNTVKICRQYATRIYQVEFSNFSSMKTLAAHLARGEWVLMIDADERITPEDLKKLPNLCNNKDGKVAFRFPRKRWLDLEMKNQTELEAFPDYQLRLFRSFTTTLFIGIIDECVRGLILGTDKDIDPNAGPFIHHFQDVFHTSEYWQQRREQRIDLAKQYKNIMEEHIFSKEIEDIKTGLGIMTKSWATKG